jgi:hypothetical protein
MIAIAALQSPNSALQSIHALPILDMQGFEASSSLLRGFASFIRGGGFGSEASNGIASCG